MNNNDDILHIIPFAHLGGTEKDCLYFIETNKQNKHYVYVLEKSGPMCKQWENVGAEVVVLNILNKSDREFTKSLFSIINNKSFKAILYWSNIKLPLVRYALRNQKCRLAVHVGNPPNWGIMSIIKQVIYHVFYASGINTCLFACSEYVSNFLRIHPYFRNFSIRVSLNPVKLLINNPYTGSLGKEIILGMTARLDRIKDHFTLIKTLAILKNDYPNIKLWLIGDGEMREILEKYSKQCGVYDSIVFYGQVEDVYGLLQKIDIFVYSTTEKEGLGNSVMEAMACGLPCVLPDLPMMREIDGGSNSAMFYLKKNEIDFASKIKTLIEDHKLRKDLSERAFDRATKSFSAERYLNDRMDFLLS